MVPLGSSAAFFFFFCLKQKNVKLSVLPVWINMSIPLVKIIISLDSYDFLARMFFGCSVHYYCALARCFNQSVI